MTTLVTGATGQVGSRFVPRLLGTGERVRILVRNPGAAAALAKRGAEVVAGDLTDADARKRAVDGVDAVVHLAAAFRGNVSEAESTATNTEAAIGLARAALEAGAGRHVFTSTNLVYGPGHKGPQNEESELRPGGWGGPYPASKIAAERALRELHATAGLGLRIVRLAFVYGEGDPHIDDWMKRGLDWSPAKRLQMIHHADVGQALLRALATEGVNGRTYNVADDSAATAAELYAVSGLPVPPETVDKPVEDPWYGVVSTARARRELGFRPIYPTVHQAVDAGTL